MLVSGVRSSCVAWATKRLRASSATRCWVMSSIVMIAGAAVIAPHRTNDEPQHTRGTFIAVLDVVNASPAIGSQRHFAHGIENRFHLKEAADVLPEQLIALGGKEDRSRAIGIANAAFVIDEQKALGECVASGIQIGAAFLAAAQRLAGAFGSVLAAKFAGLADQLIPGGRFRSHLVANEQRIECRFARGQNTQCFADRAQSSHARAHPAIEHEVQAQRHHADAASANRRLPAIGNRRHRSRNLQIRWTVAGNNQGKCYKHQSVGRRRRGVAGGSRPLLGKLGHVGFRRPRGRDNRPIRKNDAAERQVIHPRCVGDHPPHGGHFALLKQQLARAREHLCHGVDLLASRRFHSRLLDAQCPPDGDRHHAQKQRRQRQPNRSDHRLPAHKQRLARRLANRFGLCGLNDTSRL